MPYSYPITNSNLYATITGSTNTKIEDVNIVLKRLDDLVEGKIYQIFDADKIADQRHLYYAAANAYYAMENGSNISNRLDVETLLYTSTQNQISKAIKMIGVSKKTKNIAMLVISDIFNDPTVEKIANFLGNMDDKTISKNPAKFEKLKELHDVTSNSINAVGGDEYDALVSLITEKGALISLRR